MSFYNTVSMFELVQLHIHVYQFEKRQCLLHRPGFQHLIAATPAAAVVFFFTVQFTISQAGIAAQSLTLIIRF